MREFSNHAVLSMSDSTVAVSSKYTQDLSVQIVFFTFSCKWCLCFYFWTVIWSYIVDLFAGLHELASASSRTVFQARAPSRNSIKYRAGDLCGNLICKCFCWMLGDPHFFFGRALSFLILSIILKNKKNLYVGSFNYFSNTIQIGSN